MKGGEDLTRTAYHEAGHAVLHHALGIGCGAVTIRADHDAGIAGAAMHGGAFGRPAQDFGEEDDDVATLRFLAEDAFCLRHAVACCAGAEAVRQWKPRRRNWKAGADSDYHEAANYIEKITSDVESVDLLRKYALCRCTVLVEHYWPEIAAVAQLLLKRESISGDQVRKAFVKSLTSRRGHLMRW